MPDTITQAGRELDAMIAEKVMGHLVVTDAEFGPMLVIDGLTDFAAQYELPHYSTEIAAAWQVVRLLDEQGFDMLLDWGRHPSASFIPREAAYSYDRTENAISADGATAPLTICLAALRVGVRDA